MVTIACPGMIHSNDRAGWLNGLRGLRLDITYVDGRIVASVANLQLPLFVIEAAPLNRRSLSNCCCTDGNLKRVCVQFHSFPFNAVMVDIFGSATGSSATQSMSNQAKCQNTPQRTLNPSPFTHIYASRLISISSPILRPIIQST